jgi:hypothetical protein
LLGAISKGAGARIESAAFQVIGQWVKERRMREMLLAQGTVEFDGPTEELAARLKKIDNLPRLNRMAIKLLGVDTRAAVLRVR